MQVLIVDDEPLARQRLVRLVSDIAGYDVVAEADSGQQAIARVNQHRPDIVLMDIRMPVMDGLQAAKALALLDEPPAVIFCTAYNDYALEAFEANAVGYLLKPVSNDKLAQALEKAQKLNKLQLSSLAEQDEVSQPQQRQYISAKTSKGIELVPIKDIRYFHADHKYVTIVYLQEGRLLEILIDDTLKELEQEFANGFIRIHRNALVAVAHISGLDKADDGFRLRLSDIEQGPLVSRRHMPELRKFLSQL